MMKIGSVVVVDGVIEKTLLLLLTMMLVVVGHLQTKESMRHLVVHQRPFLAAFGTAGDDVDTTVPLGYDRDA